MGESLWIGMDGWMDGLIDRQEEVFSCVCVREKGGVESRIRKASERFHSVVCLVCV